MAAVLLAAAAMIATACSSGEKFNVEGTISEAEDSVLYFEHMSLSGPVAIDSVRLKADGTFHFSRKAAASPEYYRLRIANQIINLAADSTETVTITASGRNMGSQYTVEGSESCEKIKELTLMQQQLQQQIITIARDPKLGASAVADSLNAVVDAYKEQVKRNYIYAEPMKPQAYFALFQTVYAGGWQPVAIFSPRGVDDDIRAFAAVATSWDAYYPGTERTENLHNIAIKGMKDQRIAKNKQNQTVDFSQIDVSNIVDIALPDSHGQIHRISDLKGHVVLLDFCVYGVEGATQRIMALRELYNKYHAQGLEIYQIGYDADEHFWKTQTAALPWTCVYDAEGIGSRNIVSYNVLQLPTYFLLGRDCSVDKRDVQISDIDKAIRSLM